MKKLSVKLGVIFFIIMFGLMTFMFFFLHESIVETRVQEELHTLQDRGNSHRAILEKHFVQDTIDHVVLMESESDTDVVITDSNGEVLNSSSDILSLKKYIQIPTSTIDKSGEIIEDNWTEEPYIATISPVYSEKEQLIGYVYMLQPTSSIKTLIGRLNEHFILAGWVAVILTFIIIIFLSKAITKPLIKMKEATSQISKGNFSVTLPRASDDELGDLSHSIELLATDLNYLKQERNEFLASISHELRTPLTYIKGYADIIHKRNLSKEEREKYLKIILDETSRLSQLIEELFKLAKIDQNSFVINKESIELQKYLANIKQKLTPAFQDKQMNFNMSCEADLLLQADPLRLEQILLNLIDNAKKYSYDGGHVELSAWKDKSNIHLSVSDNGKGIPEKDLPYIFNRFYRVDKSRTRSLGGTGLGLAIVKELVHAHGAEIIVYSKENEGTIFEIIFKGV